MNKILKVFIIMNALLNNYINNYIIVKLNRYFYIIYDIKLNFYRRNML